MIKFTFIMEDVEGSIERLESGKYLLKVKSEEHPTEERKEITNEEAAAMLFASFDPQFDADSPVQEIFDAASEGQAGLETTIVP